MDSLQYASSDSETSSSDDLYESEESYESDGEENEDSLVYSWVDRSKYISLITHSYVMLTFAKDTRAP